MGLGYQIGGGSCLSLNYEFIDLGNASMDKQFISVNRRLSGDYSQRAHVLNVAFVAGF